MISTISIRFQSPDVHGNACHTHSVLSSLSELQVHFFFFFFSGWATWDHLGSNKETYPKRTPTKLNHTSNGNQVLDQVAQEVTNAMFSCSCPKLVRSSSSFVLLPNCSSNFTFSPNKPQFSSIKQPMSLLISVKKGSALISNVDTKLVDAGTWFSADSLCHHMANQFHF